MNAPARTPHRPPRPVAAPQPRRVSRAPRVVALAVLTLGLLGGTVHALTTGHGSDGAQRHALFLAGAAMSGRSPSPSPTGAQASPSPAPSLSPEPGGTATPAPGSENGDGGGGTGGEAEPCSLLDLGCKAREAVTDWFRELVETASGPTFELLGSTVLATPEMDSAEMSRARQLWGVSQTIANTCFVLLVTLAGALLMGGTSLPSEIGIKDLLPRAVLAFLAANLSQTLIGYGIGFANGLATAFLDSGRRRIDPEQAADVFGRGVEASINTGGVFLILVALVVVVLAVCVAFVYVVRLVVTMVLIAAAPIALMFHALPQTEGIAVLWWRTITGLLAIQVCQSLVFVAALQLLFTQDAADNGSGRFYGLPTTSRDVIDLLMMICLLWILIRVPYWVSRAIWRQGRPRVGRQIVSTYLAYRTVHRVFQRSHRSGRSRRTSGGDRRKDATGGAGGGGSGRSGNASGAGGAADPGGGGRRHGRGDAGGRRSGGGRDGGGGGRGPADASSGAAGAGPHSGGGGGSHGGGGRGGGGHRGEEQRRRNQQRYERNRDRYRDRSHDRHRHHSRDARRPPDPHRHQRHHRNG